MSEEQPLLLTDLVAHTNQVPARFIRPISDRPNLHEVDKSDTIFPLIDLDGFSGSNPSQIIKEIGEACQTHGFFLVKNHGIEECIINDMLRVSKEFFLLSELERLKNYSSDPLKTTRLSTSFNVNKESISSWRDYLRLHCYPLEDYVHEWPSNPPSFRETVSKYCTNVRGLVLKLLEVISESLGLEKGYMDKALSKQAQHMAINYYPPCPQPELTYGLPGHKDPNALTVLLQDQVPGLQVLFGGKWVTVKPIPGTFVVNIGDQIQVLSNGIYKSILHRALVNSHEERMSIPTFYCPSPDAVIGPAQELVDDHHPAIYKNFTYKEYYELFWNHGLQTESCIDSFRLPA
ncbi:hypothetical protein MRB53_025808 [Persea americana]|uniref:Uncharacterized protein n=1 Tax=Persea americana TaxID=3435 RepID=A0ACC2LG54_PERAE|nr:hypothetical protein MRB53_025808 [Persea americana]